MPHAAANTLLLTPAVSSRGEALRLDPSLARVTIGRSPECHGRVDDVSVSRRHAAAMFREQQWFLTDLGSRHGTYVNGLRLDPDAAVPLEAGDFVRIGSCLYCVQREDDRPRTLILSRDEAARGDATSQVDATQTSSLSAKRLDLLFECSASFMSAPDEPELARLAVDAVVRGTGVARCALLRSDATIQEAEVIAHRASSQVFTQKKVTYSRSLLVAASQGRLAQLTSHAEVDQPAHSIVKLGIRSALCAPIMDGGSVVGFLYMDSRGDERTLEADAAGFCHAMARLYGLALAAIKAQEARARQQRLVAGLETLRRAQRAILPASGGSVGPLTFAFHSRAGAIVGGDLCDIVRIDNDSAALIFGDVTGHGVDCAVLMAVTQTYLRAELKLHGDVGHAVTSVNRYLSQRDLDGRFVTLWVGRVDRRHDSLTFVDAGHGHWLIKRPGGEASRQSYRGGIPVGIDPNVTYTAEASRFDPGSRCVVFSDGLVEQASPVGEMFGIDRVCATSSEETPLDALVQRLVEQHERHTNGGFVSDDTTVVAFECARPASDAQ